MKVGNAADLLLVDTPIGSEAGDALAALALGDTPAIAAAIIDGVVRVYGSRNTPGSSRKISIPWMAAGGTIKVLGLGAPIFRSLPLTPLPPSPRPGEGNKQGMEEVPPAEYHLARRHVSLSG